MFVVELSFVALLEEVTGKVEAGALANVLVDLLVATNVPVQVAFQLLHRESEGALT